VTTLEALQEEMILAVQTLSLQEQEGTLTHALWAETLQLFEKRIGELPVSDQSGIDTEPFYPIEPEDS
jgi:hypothetical protein